MTGLPHVASQVRPDPRRVRRLRAHRWTPAQFPLNTNVLLPDLTSPGVMPAPASVSRAILLNVSVGGLLMASRVALAPGARTVVRLGGPDRDHAVGIRILRAVTVAGLTGPAFDIAAAFEEPLPGLPAVQTTRPCSALALTRLRDLIPFVNAAARRHGGPGALQRGLEIGLGRVMPAAYEIQIRDAPAPIPRGCESVYFRLPPRTAAPHVLQAVFDRQYALEPHEFEVLEASASLAADALELDHASLNVTTPPVPAPPGAEPSA